jgi:NADPH:quinone reductase-like Zn-dependent oxidoreductase
MYAIKLASLAGYKVVTVASKHNWDLVKSLGASTVFDYKDSDVIKHVKQWANDQGLGPIKKGLDTISENGSIEKCTDILSDGAGELVVLRTCLPSFVHNGC